MLTVNVREARGRIGQLLDAVEAGEEVLIERYGKPVARLVAVEPEQVTAQFPDRRAFRRRLPVNEGSSADVVRELRNDERF